MKTNIRVLLVEDDKVDQIAFRRFVAEERLPYDLSVAGSIAEATAALVATKFDVLIVDYSLGDGTALDILAQAKDMPVVVITGTGSEAIAVNTLKAGAYDYLTKDFDRNYLKIMPITVENALRHCGARKALKESEERFKTLAEKSPNMVYINKGGRIVYANKKCEEVMGYTREEFLSPDFNFLLLIAPESLELVRDTFGRHMNGEDTPSVEYTLLTRAGTRIETINNSKLIDLEGEAAILGIITDITDRKNMEKQIKEFSGRLELTVKERTDELTRANRALHAIVKCREAIVHAESEQALINEVCRVMVEAGGYRFAWVGYAEHDENKTVRPMAYAGHENGYLQAITVRWDDSEFGRGPTGTSIRAGKPAVFGDIADEPVSSPWREEALKRGYASVVGLPLKTDSEIIGAITIYAGTGNVFSTAGAAAAAAAERTLLTELANDITYGIRSLRTEAQEKLGEVALRDSEETYRALIETTNTGFVIIDHAGKVLDANQEYVHLAGYGNLNEIRGRSVVEWTAAYDKEKSAKAVAMCVRDGYIRNLEIDCVNGQGKVTPIEINATVVEKVGMPRILTLCRDITERKQKEAELREAAVLAQAGIRAREAFLANISHELITPLNSIVGFSQILLDGLGGPMNEKQKKFAASILQGGKRLHDVLKEIVQFAGLESGEMQLHADRFLLKDLLKSPLLALNEKAVVQGVDLSLVIGLPPETEIEADREKLQQVMFNLLDNAVKFTPKGGSVSVNARLSAECGVRNAELKEDDHSELQTPNSALHGNCIEVSVTDTGIGITEDDLPRLFSAFEQFELPYTKKYKGTGLGLILAKKIIELHGGRIWVVSEIGKGSTFTFVIPVSQKNAECGLRNKKGDFHASIKTENSLR